MGRVPDEAQPDHYDEKPRKDAMPSTVGAGEFRTKVLVVEDEEFTRTILTD